MEIELNENPTLENSTKIKFEEPTVITESMTESLQKMIDSREMWLEASKVCHVKVGDIVTVGDRECWVRKITGKDYILRPLPVKVG